MSTRGHITVLAVGAWACLGCLHPGSTPTNRSSTTQNPHTTSTSKHTSTPKHTSGCAAPMPGMPSTEPFRRVRSTRDLPDDHPDAYSVHVLYVQAHDQVKAATNKARGLDEDGSIRRSVSAFNAWLKAKSGGTSLRFDTCDGLIDVTHVTLPKTWSQADMAMGQHEKIYRGSVYVRGRLESYLSKTFNHPKKLYLVYYDGLVLGRCGGAAYPPLLPGRMTAIYLGGRFMTTLLREDAPAGAKVLKVHEPALLGAPAPSHITLGHRSLKVQAIQGDQVFLSAPLAKAARAGATVSRPTRIPACGDNPMSADGQALGYMDYAALHEVFHALGAVSRKAPHHNPRAAYGHLSEASAGGVFDLMYQGAAAWGCARQVANAQASTCVLDPGRQNYWRLPAGSPGIDLSRSVFMTPLPQQAQAPPRWQK